MLNSKSQADTEVQQSTNVDAALGQAQIAQNPLLGDAFRVYKELSDGNRLWFGTHRNDNMDFEKNIFGGWKPNAYLLSKEVATKICKEYDAKMEAAFQSIA